MSKENVVNKFHCVDLIVINTVNNEIIHKSDECILYIENTYFKESTKDGSVTKLCGINWYFILDNNIDLIHLITINNNLKMSCKNSDTGAILTGNVLIHNNTFIGNGELMYTSISKK